MKKLYVYADFDFLQERMTMMWHCGNIFAIYLQAKPV